MTARHTDRLNSDVHCKNTVMRAEHQRWRHLKAKDTLYHYLIPVVNFLYIKLSTGVLFVYVCVTADFGLVPGASVRPFHTDASLSL